MTKNEALKVLIGQTENGFVAVSAEGPFFCLEASSEEAVIEKARKAVRFHYARQQSAALAPARVPGKRVLNISTFIPWKTVEMNDYVAA